MAVLSASDRRQLPAGQFAGPGRSFPIPDQDHAEKALQLVGRSESAGNLTASQAATIKAKARAKLGDDYGSQIMAAAKRKR